MKAALLLIVAMVMSAPAVAANKNCEPYTEYHGDFSTTVFPCLKEKARTSCIEGEVQYFPVENSGGETVREEARTCKNGAFFPRTRKVIKYRGCTEGEVAYTTVNDGGEGGREVAIVCRKGRFVIP